MKFNVTPDKKYLQLVEYTEDEYFYLSAHFTKKIEDYWYKKKIAKLKNYTWNEWDGKVKFFTDSGRMPFGLWYELYNFAKTYNVPLQIDGIKECFNKVDYEEVNNFIVDNVTSRLGYDARNYQIEGVAKLLEYKRALLEIATSGGKTFMLYCFWLYLHENNLINKMLIVVPSIDLVNQMYKDFHTYHNHTKSKLKIARWFDGNDDYTNDSQILVSTYQTLTSKNDKLIDFYENFQCVAVDESHTVKTKSLKSILNNCKNSEYIVGVSGTLKTKKFVESASLFTIEAMVGPIVLDISAKDLINAGYSADVKLKCLVLDYLTEEEKKNYATVKYMKSELDETKVYNLERDLIRENPKRTKFCVNLLSKTKGNTIFFFTDVKNRFGKKIYEQLKEVARDKVVYYIDGSTPSNTREYIISQMELDNDKILIASYGTFSTGINIKNIHVLVFGESYKSEIKVIQTIGRGLRKPPGKEFVQIFDIVDNFVYNLKLNDENKRIKNYMVQHFEERKRIYESEGYDISIRKILLE